MSSPLTTLSAAAVWTFPLAPADSTQIGPAAATLTTYGLPQGSAGRALPTYGPAHLRSPTGG